MAILSLCMMIKAELLPLRANAFDYEDGSPWVKRTVNLTQTINLNGSTNDGRPYGQSSFTIYNINTDEMIQPLNVRVSVAGSQIGSNSGAYRCTITEPGTYSVFWDSGRLSEPCINCPVQLGGLSSQTYYAQCYGYSSAVYAVTVTITYDVYYKYETGGGETFTLPADWVQSTTGSALEQPTMPTITTAVTPSDASENFDNWITIPTKITDCANFFGAVIINIFEMKYVTFIVLYGILCALLVWFLH